MKHLAATLFLATVTATGLYAMGSGATGSSTAQAPGQAADFGPQSSALRRPTPAPQSSAAPSGKKEPLTAALYKDDKGKESASVFTASDPQVYVKWIDGTGVKGDKVRVAWYAVDTGGAVSKNKKLTESTSTLTGDGQSGSSFIAAPKGGFPVGTYRVDVYDGAKLAKSLKFTVKK